MNALLSTDLLFSSQLAGAAAATGAKLQTVASGAALLELAKTQPLALVLVDLTLPTLDLDGLVPELKALFPPPCVLAFGPHVHEERLAAATTAGCDLVFSRGQLHRDARSLFAGQADDGVGAQ